MQIKEIVESTLTGKTALDIASLRPNAFVIATTTDEKVARSLALKWGVYTKIVPMFNDTDEIVKEGMIAAKEMLNLKAGDLVAVVGGFPHDAHTNFIKIESIEE